MAYPMFGDFIGEWHKWFAWWPVYTYDNRRVWLRCVWRRCVMNKYIIDPVQRKWWWYQIEAPNGEG